LDVVDRPGGVLGFSHDEECVVAWQNRSSHPATLVSVMMAAAD
jgi:hypothetical protein